jgi:hypothetical protein
MLAAVAAIGLCGSCSSLFNQSFINLVAQPVVDSTGAVPSITLDNAPGHVPIVFVNNTRFDQTLIDYFDSIGVDTSDPDLRPRVRVRTDIQYVNGNSITLEFIDGSDIVQSTVQTLTGPRKIRWSRATSSKTTSPISSRFVTWRLSGREGRAPRSRCSSRHFRK